MFAAISYDPIVRIEIGSLDVSPHGIGIAVGFLLGALVMRPTAERRGIDADTLYSLLTRAAIGAIVGARIAYVLNHFNEYDSALDMLKVWQGGISLLGGFVGAIIAAIPYMRSRRMSFWQVMDAAAPGMAVGVIIGRIGDIVIADHLGKAIDGDFVLGYRCPPATVETGSSCVAGPGGVVHQPHVYDLILTVVLLGVLLWLRRKPRYDGFLILVFGAGYGFNRFVEDWFRIDETHGLGLTGSQWTAVASIVVCLYVLLFRRQTPAWGRWNESGDGAAVASPDTEPGTEPDDESPPFDGEREVQPADGPTMTIPPQNREE